jgi:uncharacterized protein YecE (DUF72 family)
MTSIRVGTCSWTDPTMVRAWYPASVRGAADRLRYYATFFDTVEVNSSYYGIPTPDNARLWAERTPPEFTFHVKAFGMMTRHAVKPDQLPPPLRAGDRFELDRSGRIIHPEPSLRADTFSLFAEALEPLRAEGKLGMILMQFPPYFVENEPNREYIAWARDRLAPDRMAVEFRHNSWIQPEVLDNTLQFLESLGASYVCVDEPRMQTANTLPPISAATSDIGYVRFSGRNAATWNARVSSAAERFRYLYEEPELREWVEPIRALGAETTTTYVMFNNCFADYAPRNARQMMSLLDLLED